MSKIARRKKTSPLSPQSLTSPQLLELVEASLDADKAIDVMVIDLTGKTDFADYMVIASGTSKRHVSTMAVHLRQKMKARGVKGVAFEGMMQCDWVLIDGGDLIVHLFRPEVREFYQLEKIWNQATPDEERDALGEE